MTLDDMLRDLVRRIVREELAALGNATNADEYLSTGEASRVAKVVPATIRRWIADGKLRGYSAGRELRVSRADLERRLETGRDWDEKRTPEQLARLHFECEPEAKR